METLLGKRFGGPFTFHSIIIHIQSVLMYTIIDNKYENRFKQILYNKKEENRKA